jgi:uncharacterized protein YdaU (DUF1376 family)
MSKMPWVRFFPSDWLGGTRGMSAVETGIYITLVATMYERGEPIPEDHSRLSRLCGASNSAFKTALDALVNEGKIIRVEGGLWNARVEKERVYLSEKSEVGLRAANARWGKKDKENNDDDDADALQAQCAGNANQKPDTRYQKSFSLRSKDGRAGEFEKFWEIYPNKVGRRKALLAFEAARKRADLEPILIGLRRYAEKTDDRPWCNPATWLHGDRWEDDPAAPPVRQPRKSAIQERHERIQAMGRRPRDDFTGATIDHEPVDYDEVRRKHIADELDRAERSWK